MVEGSRNDVQGLTVEAKCHLGADLSQLSMGWRLQGTIPEGSPETHPRVEAISLHAFETMHDHEQIAQPEGMKDGTKQLECHYAHVRQSTGVVSGCLPVSRGLGALDLS